MALYDSYYRYTWKFGSELDGLDSLEERKSDGSGNNLAHTDWGTAHSHFLRATPNSYLDGVGQWDVPIAAVKPVPPTNPVGDAARPRDITDLIMAQDPSQNIPSSARHNEYFQFFGQFLTHDMAEAGVTGNEPPLFLDGLPFPLGRTPFVIGSDAHNTNVRQQENDETSFLDLSQVYGHSDAIRDLLRAPGAQSAYLLSGAGNGLPTYQQVADAHGTTFAAVQGILDPNPLAPISPDNFAAGDNRANQQTALLTHHALWMRNHNWFVDQLKAGHPDWSQDELFEAARALNEADWQNVVYNEYVAKLIGPNALSKYSGYKANVDPSVINEWTTVAFRFGHDETSNDLGIMNEKGTQLATFTLGEAFGLGANGIRDEAGLDNWIRGQLARVTQEIDGKVVDGNRNVLFGIPGATVDLEVFDIQRGRDHGVGRYNALREGLGLAAYDSFDQFASANNVDAATLANLKTLYGADGIDTLDSIVGGLLEKNAKGSALGETFTILNVMQWEAVRDGDRLFHLNRFKDDPDLLKMIKATSLSDIIERNSDIDHVYHDAFLAHTRKGGTSANNTLTGTGGLDLLIGFGGNDKLSGKAGNDDIYGDEGNDTVLAGGGADRVWGGIGNDNLNGEEGNDYVDGGDGNDTVKGATSDDFVFGGKGNDKLYGDAGKDYLDGGEGNDQIWGGGSRDIFAFGYDSGSDIVQDFKKSEDRLDLSQLDFDTLAEVRAAAHRVGKDTILTLEDGDQVRLVGVNYTLASSHLILNGDYIV
jgi:peroxidase